MGVEFAHLVGRVMLKADPQWVQAWAEMVAASAGVLLLFAAFLAWRSSRAELHQQRVHHSEQMADLERSRAAAFRPDIYILDNEAAKHSLGAEVTVENGGPGTAYSVEITGTLQYRHRAFPLLGQLRAIPGTESRRWTLRVAEETTWTDAEMSGFGTLRWTAEYRDVFGTLFTTSGLLALMD